jgi:hypothetical protein
MLSHRSLGSLVFEGISSSDLGYGRDIAPSTMSLGDGWRPLEVDRSGRFRPIAGIAQALFASAGYIYEVIIDIAPAPDDMGSVYFDARVDGISYYANPIHGRTRVRFLMSPGEPAMRRISLHATGGTARVYRVAALPHGYDVVPSWLGFRIGGGGWYPLEGSETGTFRYVNREGEIVIGRPARSLELDVEPGPGVASGVVELDISTGDRELLRRVRVERRTRIAVQLPELRDFPGRLVVSCKGGGRPAPPDGRLMDFRLFAMPAPWARSELLRSLASLGPPDAPQPAENEAAP